MRRRSRDRGKRQKPWWRSGATLVAVVGLVVGLLYNGFNVRAEVDQEKAAAGQERRTREATEIGLLTQLNAGAIASEQAIDATDVPERRCSRTPLLSLTGHHRQRAALFAALGYYEYLAWLFNHRELTMRDALDYWRSRMILMYDTAVGFYGR